MSNSHLSCLLLCSHASQHENNALNSKSQINAFLCKRFCGYGICLQQYNTNKKHTDLELKLEKFWVVRQQWNSKSVLKFLTLCHSFWKILCQDLLSFLWFFYRHAYWSTPPWHIKSEVDDSMFIKPVERQRHGKSLENYPQRYCMYLSASTFHLGLLWKCGGKWVRKPILSVSCKNLLLGKH